MKRARHLAGPRPADVLEAAARYALVDPEDLRARFGSKRLRYYRRLAMAAAFEFAPDSAVAREFGRDRAIVHRAVRETAAELAAGHPYTLQFWGTVLPAVLRTVAERLERVAA